MAVRAWAGLALVATSAAALLVPVLVVVEEEVGAVVAWVEGATKVVLAVVAMAWVMDVCPRVHMRKLLARRGSSKPCKRCPIGVNRFSRRCSRGRSPATGRPRS